MDHRTRVASAIKRLPVDRIPCAELVITDAIVQTMFNQATVQFEHRLEFINTIGLDGVCLHPSCTWSSGRTPCATDVVFNDWNQWVNTDLFTFAVLNGPIGWGGNLLGFEKFMVKLVRCHSEYQDLVIAVEKMNMSVIERLAGSGVNGILLADDIAYNQGLIVRPDILRQTLFPSLTRQVEYAKRLGLSVFFHSDGNLMAVLDDIVAAGFDGLQCIEALAGMDIGAIKEQYGHKLCLWGNLDPAELLEVRNPHELEHRVKHIVHAGGCAGGAIFGTSSGLFEFMRLDNIKTVYKIAQSIAL